MTIEQRLERAEKWLAVLGVGLSLAVVLIVLLGALVLWRGASPAIAGTTIRARNFVVVDGAGKDCGRLGLGADSTNAVPQLELGSEEDGQQAFFRADMLMMFHGYREKSPLSAITMRFDRAEPSITLADGEGRERAKLSVYHVTGTTEWGGNLELLDLKGRTRANLNEFALALGSPGLPVSAILTAQPGMTELVLRDENNRSRSFKP